MTTHSSFPLPLVPCTVVATRALGLRPTARGAGCAHAPLAAPEAHALRAGIGRHRGQASAHESGVACAATGASAWPRSTFARVMCIQVPLPKLAGRRQFCCMSVHKVAEKYPCRQDLAGSAMVRTWPGVEVPPQNAQRLYRPVASTPLALALRRHRHQRRWMRPLRSSCAYTFCLRPLLARAHGQPVPLSVVSCARSAGQPSRGRRFGATTARSRPMGVLDRPAMVAPSRVATCTPLCVFSLCHCEVCASVPPLPASAPPQMRSADLVCCVAIASESTFLRAQRMLPRLPLMTLMGPVACHMSVRSQL